MLSFIKNKLQKIYTQFTSAISGFFGKTSLDENTLHELEKLLLSADTGVQTTRFIIERLKEQIPSAAHQPLREVLAPILLSILNAPRPPQSGRIYMLVGINGSGKTTCAGKLASLHARAGKKVLLVAADTFRAAAPEQLKIWAERTGVEVEMGATGQDTSSVVFKGCERFKAGSYDILIIDTAGRLHTKNNLMNELAKVSRVIAKHFPNEQPQTMLTIDSMLGQNSLEQARTFKESTQVGSIILTKMDGTGKGGIVFAIARELNLPISFITFGEKIEDIKEFDAAGYVAELLEL